MDPFIGQIVLFGGNFAPRSWALCDGQLLAIASNTALFSLLGTTYGGDGRTTFALPDLRGRAPIHAGTGPGLSTVRLGERGGNESTTLSANNLPPHNHPLAGTDAPGTTQSPSGTLPAQTAEDAYASGTPTSMNAGAVGNNTTANQNFSNRPPYLGLNYIIALQGVFPSRS